MRDEYKQKPVFCPPVHGRLQPVWLEALDQQQALEGHDLAGHLGGHDGGVLTGGCHPRGPVAGIVQLSGLKEEQERYGEEGGGKGNVCVCEREEERVRSAVAQT
jgi:hypothetical protein